MYTGLHARYEEELMRNPYSVKTWWNYIHFNTDQPAALRFSIYERALSHLPRSYKLWHAYLIERTQHARGSSAKSKKVDLLINCYERALITLHAMPRIW
jgi:pre-mRNA-splicing factor SYF1